VRQEHTDCVVQHGKLLGEQDAHNQQVADREQLIRELGDKHKIKSSTYSSPHEFLARLDELRSKQTAELEKIQV
jgi:DNA repair protein RAD50